MPAGVGAGVTFFWQRHAQLWSLAIQQELTLEVPSQPVGLDVDGVTHSTGAARCHTENLWGIWATLNWLW
jgi:hypothetical protein